MVPSRISVALSLSSVPPTSASLSSVATTVQSYPVPLTTAAPIEASGEGLLLSPSAEVIPKKLLDKMRSGKFIEMKELLQDNMMLAAQVEELQGPLSMHVIGAARPRLREITSLPTWCYCFLGYAAAMTSDPVTRDHLAYARLIIRQAQGQGGLAYLDYDRAFRQQVAADPSIRWNTLNPSLLASTVLGHRSTGARYFCTLCRAVDHTRTQCALAYMEPPAPSVAPPSYQRVPGPVLPRRAANPPATLACFRWNRGLCSSGDRCRFQHVCTSCFGAHRAPECPLAMTRPAVTRPMLPQMSAGQQLTRPQ